MVGLRVFAAVVALTASAVQAASVLPTVDLGYAVHRATVNVSISIQKIQLLDHHAVREEIPNSLSWLSSKASPSEPAFPPNTYRQWQDTGYGYYNFSNIRFAEPVTGDNRFRKPVKPKGRNSTVNDGQQSCRCAQSNPRKNHCPYQADQADFN